MRITAIEPQQQNPTRRNIYVDDEYAVGIGLETLLRFGLRKGDEISGARLAELRQAEDDLCARTVALRYISHRPRTEREIRDKLREKEFSDEAIGRVIEALRTARLVDDQQFALSYARDAVLRRKVGPLMVRQKLLLLGVPRPVVDQTIESVCGTDTQIEAALDVAHKAMKKRAGKPEATPLLKKRIAAHLGRRGYKWDVIAPVLKRVFAEHNPPEEEL